MIYDKVDPIEPIEQGDIFFNIPFTTIDLNQIVFKRADQTSTQTGRWSAIENKNSLTALLDITPTWAIVLSQDCDATRAPAISMFRIEPLSKILGHSIPQNDKKWADYIVNQLGKKQTNNFYLPADSSTSQFKIGFTERMFINLETVFQLDRESLEAHKESLRKGRLNEESYEHYRESIAQYFRRYPYEEHYPLTKAEVEAYERNKNVLVNRRPYQK